MNNSLPADFLCCGGLAQRRYEELRQRWVELDPAVSSCLVWWPWGRRLLHFGVLGLLDEDPSGQGWFGSRAIERPESLRCVRVLMGSAQGEERMRRAYQMLLQLPVVTERSAVVTGDPR